jgi:oxygen-dependent protoporphyrinogen oxidase
MKKIAILGGGIAGLAAAYELELARQRGAEIDWHLYEATNRLGGILETKTETATHGDYILEGGPDAWVTDKPWARDLALELGLESQLIASNDETRKTYIFVDHTLQPMPDRMRMMVPTDLSTLAASPLFTDSARAAYAAELANATHLRESAPTTDESVATFVLRHFGEEVLTKIAAPLLSGVFGGDVAKLSVRAVMAPFVAMEREHGSLILALQERAKARGSKPPQPTFTSLQRGMGSLTAAIIAKLPAERLHLQRAAFSLKREGKLWCLRTTNTSGDGPAGKSKRHFHHVLLATPVDATRTLLQPLDAEASALIPTDASSAVLATFCWPAETARTFTIPSGFGFLVPPKNTTDIQLLACTFVDQKFTHRAPAGARIIRTFFGGPSADALAPQSDANVAAVAFAQLSNILGTPPPPDAALTTVRRWPRSLPQYEVGHLQRIAELDTRIAILGHLTLLGNAYRGVGVPDLIHHSREAARSLAER